MTIRTLYSKYRQLLLYVFWGAATTAVNYATYYLLRQIDGLYILLSGAFAWLASVLFAFWSNKSFVFESKSWAPRVALPELWKFMEARLFSGALETFILWLCVEQLALPEGLTKVGASVLVVILNYVFSKLLIFPGGAKNG